MGMPRLPLLPRHQLRLQLQLPHQHRRQEGARIKRCICPTRIPALRGLGQPAETMHCLERETGTTMPMVLVARKFVCAWKGIPTKPFASPWPLGDGASTTAVAIMVT